MLVHYALAMGSADVDHGEAELLQQLQDPSVSELLAQKDQEPSVRDVFLVNNASFAVPLSTLDIRIQNLLKQISEEQFPSIDFLVSQHRDKQGKGTILAIREFSEGSTGVLDDESFQKVTLLLPQIRDLPTAIRAQDILGFISSGSSSAPEHGRYGMLQSGLVEIGAAKEEQVEINIDLVFSQINTWDHFFFEERQGVALPDWTISGHFIAKIKDLSALTSWQGASESPHGAETYPSNWNVED